MGAIAMLNGLWFKPNGGREMYAEYGQAVMPLMAKAGADLVIPFVPVEKSLEGGFDPDAVGVVRYPSQEAFDAMWQSDEYQAVAHLRTDAISKAVLTRCAIDPVDSGPATGMDTGIAVLNGLWFTPGGAAAYDEYLAAAKPVVEGFGGRFITPRFKPEQSFGEDFCPDLLFFGQYPALETVFDLLGSDAYAKAAAIRATAVERSATTVLRLA